MNKLSLYLECNTGISGDMAVAALLDAGADKNVLQKALDSIPVRGFKTEITRVKKAGIECCDFNVILDVPSHDHDMEYLFGHEHGEAHGHCHEAGHHNDEAHGHCHEAGHHSEEAGGHCHEAGHHHHEHRNLSDVMAVIGGTELTARARAFAEKVFSIIAEAESRAHGIPVEEVHFHEVGALDSIVDVISLAVCLDNLMTEQGITNVYVPYLCEGTGSIRCQHGILPVPVPAVLNIVQEYNIPLRRICDQGEFVTPTGAAFAAAAATSFTMPGSYRVKVCGLGAGKRTYSRPGILRAYIIEEAAEDSGDEIMKLETDIDDCTGEVLGFVMEELLNNGALDVHYVPCFSKKNRPSYELCVICREENSAKLQKIIFLHTTTLGIRFSRMKRSILQRQCTSVQTEWGSVKVKKVSHPEGTRIYPEYESIASIAREQNKSFEEVYRSVLKAMS